MQKALVTAPVAATTKSDAHTSGKHSGVHQISHLHDRDTSEASTFTETDDTVALTEQAIYDDTVNLTMGSSYCNKNN